MKTAAAWPRLIIFISVFFFVIACGVKGPPLPPEETTTAELSDKKTRPTPRPYVSPSPGARSGQ